MSFTPSKTIWAGLCALGLTALPLAVPAFAQVDTTTPDTTTVPADETADDDQDFSLGWLGLLGLIGLAGLTRKPEKTQVYQDPQVYRDPTEAGRPRM